MAHRQILKEERGDNCEERLWWCWRGVTLETFLLLSVPLCLSLYQQSVHSFLEFFFFFSLLYWCGGFSVASTGVHSCAKWRGKEGFLPYLCSQQGIILFFGPGSRPSAGGWDSQDEASIQGLRICPLPTVCMCVCSRGCSCLHISSVFAVGNHRLQRGRISPHCSLTIAATVELWLLFLSVLSLFDSLSFLSLPL